MRALLLWAYLAATGGAAAQSVDARSVIAEVERNQRALQAYGWRSRVEVALGGEVREVALYASRFAEDGTVVRTRTGGESGSGRGNKKIAETVAGVEELVHSYVAAGTVGLRSAFDEAKVTEGEPGGATLIQARDVIRRGDTMKILVDAVTLRPRRFEALTSLAGEPVQLRVEFEELADGPAYPARAVVETEIKEERLVIATENSDYTKL